MCANAGAGYTICHNIFHSVTAMIPKIWLLWNCGKSGAKGTLKICSHSHAEGCHSSCRRSERKKKAPAIRPDTRQQTRPLWEPACEELLLEECRISKLTIKTRDTAGRWIPKEHGTVSVKICQWGIDRRTVRRCGAGYRDEPEEEPRTCFCGDLPNRLPGMSPDVEISILLRY